MSSISSDNSPQKLFIIDLMAMAFRCFHAFGQRPLSTSKGLPTSAIYGCAVSLLKILNEEKPDYLVVASDSKSKNFRHEIYPEYKANRSDMPEDLSAQIPYIFELIESLGIKLLKEEGFEADDIIGSLTTQLGTADIHSYIVSGDKDFMQLINDHTYLYTTKKGGIINIVGENEVFEKFGCKPNQVIDALAIIGDTADNVPGVSGIGEKGAAKLIQAYGSLDAIYENIEEISAKRQKNALEASKDTAYLSKELVIIKTDMPLGHSVEDFKIDVSLCVANEKLLNLFESLEFNTLAKKVSTLMNSPEPASEPTAQNDKSSEAKVIPSRPTNYKLINSISDLNSLVETLSNSEIFCFDTETTGLNIVNDQPVGIAFSNEPERAYYLPLHEKHRGTELPEDTVFEAITKIFSLNCRKLAHNLKFDLQMMKNFGVKVEGPFEDSMLASYCLESNIRDHGLDKLIEKHFGHQMIPLSEILGPKKNKNILDVDINELATYACEDADYTLKLFTLLEPKLIEMQVENVYRNIEVPLATVLAEIEQNGIYINIDTLMKISEELSEITTKTAQEIYEIAGEEFNINSPKQLQEIIFNKLKIHEKLNIKRIKKTKSGYSTDVSVLEKLSKHPLAAKILEYRTAAKLKSTYVDTLPQLVDEKTKRLHTHFHQNGTATGRLSSSNPNLQNIPIRTNMGKKIRTAFQAQDKDHVLISADYSQVELRLLGHIAHEENLIKAFENDEDIHRATASKVFGVTPENVTPDMRSRAKAINFGIIYGMGPQRLASETGVTTKEAKEFIEKYFSSYPKIRDYIQSSKEFAKENKYTQTLTGRKRPLPEIESENRLTQVNAENMAINSPIQGSAADLIKVAMLNVQKSLKDESMKTRMLLQVHDELVFEAPNDEVQKVCELVKNSMENAIQLKVPLLVEVGSGTDWLQAH